MLWKFSRNLHGGSVLNREKPTFNRAYKESKREAVERQRERDRDERHRVRDGKKKTLEKRQRGETE
jgi:hypothetical protein